MLQHRGHLACRERRGRTIVRWLVLTEAQYFVRANVPVDPVDAQSYAEVPVTVAPDTPAEASCDLPCRENAQKSEEASEERNAVLVHR